MLGYILIAIAGLALGVVAGVIIRKYFAEAKISSAESEAKRIVEDATKIAESRKA